MSDTALDERHRPPATPTRGHPCPDRRPVVALEAGATYLTGYALGSDGVLRAEGRWFTRPERGPDAVLESLLACAAALAGQCRPGAVGVVLPGVVDDTSGRVVRSTALGWRDVPLQDWAAEHLDLPVVVRHDGRTGALAEARAGAGRGCRDLLFVAVGDGIAASVVGATGAAPDDPCRAGELGHTVVRAGGDLCHCGARGCLETVASTAAVARRYARMTGLRGVDVREVYRRADAGEPAALAVRGRVVAALADALATAIGTYAPERVVVGGELAEAGVAPLRAALADRLAGPAVPELLPARFGGRAAGTGAALLARDMARAHAGR
ncbi:ROK family protein [Kitasatospora sp. NPDC059327]|uniref:ROK family protein n=1 Tax=Kitasatospora sp. NPDC059327 TaxID=3346803 RepID=UPI003686050F